VRALLGNQSRRLRLALVLLCLASAIAVTGASAADFEVDGGPCPESPGNAFLLRCPTAYVGEEYEVEIESEEGSGCMPTYDYFVIVNSALPPGLSMTRDGVISGTPTTVGFTRFWIFDHDLDVSQGGPSWCIRDDTSEREFSIFVDPGLEIENESVTGASIGQPYSDTLTANRVTSLNPPTSTPDVATWSVQSGVLPPGITLSPQGVLSGTPTAEGSYRFVVKAFNGSRVDTKEYSLSVRQPVLVKSPFGSGSRPSAEVGVRFAKTATASGGSGGYEWSLASGSLPGGVALDKSKGAVSGTPRAAGAFTFGLTATDADGRATTVNATLAVAEQLAISTAQLKPAKLGSAYQARVATAGGVQPFRWKVVGGALPTGVRFATRTGTVAGTPRRSGRFGLTVEARDALGAKARKTLVLRVTG
jgi:large repetitive protein